MQVNVGQAKTDLSKLIARAEAGEDVQIARDGVPVVRLVKVEPMTAGQRILANWGSMRGEFVVGDDFEWTEEEIDEMLDSMDDLE